MTVAEIKEQIIAILKESLSPIRNEEGCLTMAISESNIDFIADEIVKLFQCKNIIAEVKEAWTPDKRSFEEVEKEKQIQNDCNNCAFGICLTKDWPCFDCDGSNKWEPIKTE
jgi:hypothetical protein